MTLPVIMSECRSQNQRYCPLVSGTSSNTNVPRAGTSMPFGPAVPKLTPAPVYPRLASGPITWMLCWPELSSSENVNEPVSRWVTWTPFSVIGSVSPLMLPFSTCCAEALTGKTSAIPHNAAAAIRFTQAVVSEPSDVVKVSAA